MTAITTITAPPTLPVTAAELNIFMRSNQDATVEESLLTELISSAVNQFEAECRRPIHTTRYRQTIGTWQKVIVLGRGNVTTVHEVQRYTDAVGTTQAVTGWIPSLNLNPNRVLLPVLPATIADIGALGYLEFSAGWAPGTVPKEVLLGIKLLAAHWYANRAAFLEKNLNELPQGWKNVTGKFRLMLQGEWGQG